MKLTYEELEAKCNALTEELKQSKIDSDCYKKGMEASNERLVQLAAENAGLNKFITQSCYVFDGEQHEISDAYICATDGGIPETPSTDAFLAEVRAGARKDFIDRIEWIIRNECNPEKTETILNELQSFSETVSQEVAQ